MSEILFIQEILFPMSSKPILFSHKQNLRLQKLFLHLLHFICCHNSNTSPATRSGFKSQYQLPSSKKTFFDPSRLSRCLNSSSLLLKKSSLSKMITLLATEPYKTNEMMESPNLSMIRSLNEIHYSLI